MEVTRTQNVVDTAASAAHRTVDRAAEVAGAAERSMQAMAQSALETPQKAVHEARHRIGANPFQTVALAFASGIIVGWILRR